MVKYNKENDIRLYNYFDELKKAISANKTLEFYRAACEIVKHVIEIGSIHSGIELKKKGLWFIKKELTLSDYLANNEVKKYLNVIGVDVYSCNSIKEASDKAEKNGDHSFDIDEIANNAEFLIDLVIKIYSDIYNETAPQKEDFNDVIVLIEKKKATDLRKAKGVGAQSGTSTGTQGAAHPAKNQSTEVAPKIDDGYISIEEQLDATPRLPVCICLDISRSMKGVKFEKMKDGLGLFCDAILNDPKARRSAEISIITFNDKCDVYRSFGRLDKPILLDNVKPELGTKVSPAINCALDMLERRKEEYRKLGMEYYQPWLVLFSDGLPGDNCDEAKKRVMELEKNRKLVVLSLPILSAKDDVGKKIRTMEFMDGFSSSGALPLDSEKIREFFVWLSRSIHVSVRKGRADFSTATSDFKAGGRY